MIATVSDNTLLYPASVRDCSGPERGVLCISIVDLIFRSAMAVFSMLRAISYQYNKGNVCYVVLL